MHDNKVRLSPDVLEKAQLIASEWGLKNARAAVEAVFRRYADEYLGNSSGVALREPRMNAFAPARPEVSATTWAMPTPSKSLGVSGPCEALDVLDELLGA